MGKQKNNKKMTYRQKSKNNKLLITLRDMGINENAKYVFPEEKYMCEILKRLIALTPTKQSHLGIKFNDCKKLNSSNTEKFLKSIFSGLGINDDNIYLFETYTERKRKRENLYNTVKRDTCRMLVLRCDNGVKQSLYSAIRNALSHGNIIKQDENYILYSIKDDKREYDCEISFFLRISNIRKLDSLYKTLDKYK